MENNISGNLDSIKTEYFENYQVGGNLDSPMSILIIAITLIALLFVLKWAIDYFFYSVDEKINDIGKKVDKIGEQKLNQLTNGLKKMVNFEQTDEESKRIMNMIQNVSNDKYMSGILESTKSGLNNIVNMESKTNEERIKLLNENYLNIKREMDKLNEKLKNSLNNPLPTLPQQPPPLLPQQPPPPPPQDVSEPVIYDPIENYDYRKINDPLVDPRGRTSADEIPTPIVAAQLNFPTQGILDRYHRVGLLVCANEGEIKENPRRHRRKRDLITANGSNMSIDSVSTDSLSSSNSLNSSSSDIIINKKSKGPKIIVTSDDNNILELIGKKITDNWYKYFTSISMGNKIIKIVVHNRNRRELYDGDLVFIKELNKWYKVKLDDLDMIEYNPYFF